MKGQDIYQSVTDDIIRAIEDGQTAEKFQLPWNGFSAIPENANTGKTYRGINIPVLWAHQLHGGFKSGLWATYKQWQEQGAQVRKGEKGSHIVFWKTFETDAEADAQEETDSKTRIMARWSVVFNADQVDGFTFPESEAATGTAERIASVEDFITATQAAVKDGQGSAFYDRKQDYIGMPDMGLFRDTENGTATESYYATILHELTHWSGADHRLKREKGKRFGDSAYAFEELVAELGAAMLCAALGIVSTTRADHAQYIDGWLKALKDDKRFIFSAASQAQKAADYLFSLQAQ
jgi:antirestriction protein ArdC